MPDDDYDLLPHSELKKIEKEIESLKSDPNSPNKTLKNSIDDLSTSLKSMISIFSEAKNELRIEDEEKELLSKKIGPMTDKLNMLLDQNEKIAEGILSVAEMIKRIEMRLSKIESFGEEKKSAFSDIARKPSFGTPEFNAPDSSQGYGQQEYPQQPLQQFRQTSQQQFRQPPQFGQGFQSLRPQTPQQPSQQPSQQMQQQFQQQSPSQQPQQFDQQQKQALDDDLFSDSISGDSSSSQGQENDTTAPEQQQEQEMFRPQGMGMPPPPPPKGSQKKGFFGK